MKRLCLLYPLLTLTLAAQPSSEFEAKLETVAAAYRDRIATVTQELTDTRSRIAEEKVPLLNRLRAAEDRLLLLRAELNRQRILSGNLEKEKMHREQEAEAQKLNISFFANTAAEGLSTWSNSVGRLGPGEQAALIADLRSRLDPAHQRPDLNAAVETAEHIFARMQTALGGHTLPGVAVSAETRDLAQGQFVLLGPATLFVSEDASAFGTVRMRDSGDTPLVHALPGWEADEARQLATGQSAVVPVDITGGKALQLSQNQGTWFDHLRKGGTVGYFILGIGTFALVVAILKLLELRKFSVDSPAATQGLLKHITANGGADTQPLLARLQATSRDLFATGLLHLAKPREVIEEHLNAFILRERLQHERGLPMLAVIAAAAPLLGLLGTVVGMVKTFTLITVFGTGNAAKLSSGISEALVTTELGLSVAIPALILHGFLSYRTQKNLSLLERYAVEFVAASEDHKATVTS
jgi:biopolymer transport protein ExbB